jgi:hypothetical protein
MFRAWTVDVRLAWLSAFNGVAAIGGFLVAILGFQTASETRRRKDGFAVKLALVPILRIWDFKHETWIKWPG